MAFINILIFLVWGPSLESDVFIQEILTSKDSHHAGRVKAILNHLPSLDSYYFRMLYLTMKRKKLRIHVEVDRVQGKKEIRINYLLKRGR